MNTSTIIFLIGFLIGLGWGLFLFYRQLEITKIIKKYKDEMQKDLDFWKKMYDDK